MPSLSAPSTSSGYGCDLRGRPRPGARAGPTCGPLPWVTTTSCSRGELGERLDRDGDVAPLRRGVGGLPRWSSALPPSATTTRMAQTSQSPVDEGVERRLLGRQAVGRLLPDGAVGAVDHGGRDLLAAVGGQAVQEHRVAAPRAPISSGRDPVGLEVVEPALRARPRLAHRDPDVGVDGAGAGDGLARVRRTTVGVAGPAMLRVGPVALGAGEPQVDAGQRRRLDQRVGDVVAVADVGDGQPVRGRRSARAA